MYLSKCLSILLELFLFIFWSCIFCRHRGQNVMVVRRDGGRKIQNNPPPKKKQAMIDMNVRQDMRSLKNEHDKTVWTINLVGHRKIG